MVKLKEYAGVGKTGQKNSQKLVYFQGLNRKMKNTVIVNPGFQLAPLHTQFCESHPLSANHEHLRFRDGHYGN